MHTGKMNSCMGSSNIGHETAVHLVIRKLFVYAVIWNISRLNILYKIFCIKEQYGRRKLVS